MTIENMRAFTDSARRAAEVLQVNAEDISAAIRRVTHNIRTLRDRANRPVIVAGIEARIYARAALDTRYEKPEDRDRLIKRLVRGQHRDTILLDPENRRLVAVAAMHGWVQHRHGST